MMRLADNIPGKPHRWADAIGAWARGELVQWRYASTEATDADWRDCDYPSRGMPNWSYPGIEYRAALSSHPTPDLQAVRDETIASGQHKDLIRACNLAGLSYADCMRIVAYMPVLSHHEDGRTEPVWCGCGDAIMPDTGAKCGVCASGVALGGEKGEAGWLPIESAPKDGSDVILSNGYWAFEATSQPDGTFIRTKDRRQTAPSNCIWWQPFPKGKFEGGNRSRG